MALSAGTRLGPYEIVSSPRAGGTGEVFLARAGWPCETHRLDHATEKASSPRGCGRPGRVAVPSVLERVRRPTMWGVDPVDLPEWERLLSAERHLQALVPGAVLVGGTAAALHAGHRRSLDGDHVLEDLRPRFDAVLATLEAAAGWQTARVQKPVAILDRLDGVMTGIRQLRRTRPLETGVVSGLRVPTLAEMGVSVGRARHRPPQLQGARRTLERLGPRRDPGATLGRRAGRLPAEPR